MVNLKRVLELGCYSYKDGKNIWWWAYYFSDGSSYIQSSIGNMFVRNSKDISSKFISDNKVSYYSSKKSVGNYELYLLYGRLYLGS